MTRRFPMPMPFGWFAVAYADELAPGAVRPLRYFGRDLVLWRGEDGLPRVMDAHCPHLGAHLGHGGRVEGASVRCPFHGWRFDGEGRCVEVPYARRVPPRAAVGVWPTVERNRVVWVWYHPRREPPRWEVARVPETEDPGWTDFERYRWTVRSHSQEMGENSVDPAHFRFVHGTLTVPRGEWSFDGIERVMIQRTRVRTPRGEVDAVIESRSRGIGAGYTRFSGICETVLVNSTTPIDTGTLDVRFAFTQPRAAGGAPQGGVAAAIIANIVKQLDEDIPIWEHKTYRERPLLCDGDGPIPAFRRWMSQFYVEEGRPPAGNPIGGA
jgi:phenylpropionate dioxygenase-like ring-hydroxylating dioxygenase large terminal subunit